MRQVFRYLPLLALAFCSAVSAADAGTVKKSVGNWRLECSSGTCQLEASAKSGASAVYITLAGKKASLENYAFLVKGDIDAQHPMTFEFARLVADKSKPGCAEATDIAAFPHCFNFSAQNEDSFSGPFTACKGGMCISKLIGDPDVEKALVPRFKGFEYVILLFRDSQNALQSRVLDIRGFTAAYAEAAKLLRQGP